MCEIATLQTLGIDASRPNEARRMGAASYGYWVIEELKKIVPCEIRVVLYSRTPLRGELGALPANWSSRVLAWPSRKFWNQVRLAGEVLVRPPDLLFLPHHFIPLAQPCRMVVALYDIGFEREEGLYGTTRETYSKHIMVRAGMAAAVRLLTGGRYRLSEQDYQRLTARYAVARAARILTISAFSKREIAEVYGVGADSIDITYCGIETERFRTPVPEEQLAGILRRYGIDRPYLLYLGRLEHKKNVAGLTKAFAFLKNQYGITHQLVLSGTPGSGYEDIRAVCRDGRLEGAVVETGWVPDEEVPALMQGAELFVFPSHYEGFGLPILQAQAAGTPLACADIPVMREVAGEGAVFFDQRNAWSTAEVLHAYLADAEQRRTRCTLGQRNVERFSWERTAKAVWEALLRAWNPQAHEAIDSEK